MQHNRIEACPARITRGPGHAVIKCDTRNEYMGHAPAFQQSFKPGPGRAIIIPERGIAVDIRVHALPHDDADPFLIQMW